MTQRIKIIGGGLAGCECAYQLLKRGYGVTMYEMRPTHPTPIHKGSRLAELVCSNSLKSTDVATVQGALKEELKLLDSLILAAGYYAKVPAGSALAVERESFSDFIEKKLTSFENFELRREEYCQITPYTVVASGPLTSIGLSNAIAERLSQENLYFYDAVAPIVTGASIDREIAFYSDRYGNGEGDYLNCPMDKEEYLEFVDGLLGAERVILKEFEKREIFDACMPIEVMAGRGIDALRFGPLKPVGLRNPETGRRAYAVLQLRREDSYNGLFNLVGCQTNLKFGEQERVFRKIKALRDAEFVRYGVMHKNTFINAPKVLNCDFSLKEDRTIFFAGQLSGVEGYLESAMSGLMAGLNMINAVEGREIVLPSEKTLCGSLMRYISADTSDFQPMHVSFSLVPELDERINDKKKKKAALAERAVEDMKVFVKEYQNRR